MTENNVIEVRVDINSTDIYSGLQILAEELKKHITDQDQIDYIDTLIDNLFKTEFGFDHVEDAHGALSGIAAVNGIDIIQSAEVGVWYIKPQAFPAARVYLRAFVDEKGVSTIEATFSDGEAPMYFPVVLSDETWQFFLEKGKIEDSYMNSHLLNPETYTYYRELGDEINRAIFEGTVKRVQGEDNE